MIQKLRKEAFKLCSLLALLTWHCEGKLDEQSPKSAAGESAAFVSRLDDSEVTFVHQPGGFGVKFLIETTMGGGSLLDYDSDGLLDLYFCQGAPMPGHPNPVETLDRLYRNLGNYRFEDVTEATQAADASCTLSVSCPDLDGDGDPDLYLCNQGFNRLLINEAGRFVDRTQAAGIAGGADEWSSAAAFLDLDGDQDLDLYVCNYVLVDYSEPKRCGEPWRGEEYLSFCHPNEFLGLDDRVYRNDGVQNGVPVFSDVSESFGVVGRKGKGLALVPCDTDLDGDLDLYVANDSVDNFFWRNDGNFKFSEVALEMGLATSGSGRSQACMGSDAADVDGDGDLDLFSANFTMETNTLYTNEGGSFVDDTTFSGLGQPSLLWVGFGAKFFDFDLDLDQDLAVVNGHISDNVHLIDPHITYRQPAQLFENIGRGKFQLVENAGSYFQEMRIGRALAAGDLDNDGDGDLLVCNNSEPPQILENRTNNEAEQKSWIGVQLIGSALNRDAIGAKVFCESGGVVQIQEVRGIGSYAAWNDMRVVFGLKAEGCGEIRVQWPDGEVTIHSGLTPGEYHRLSK